MALRLIIARSWRVRARVLRGPCRIFSTCHPRLRTTWDTLYCRVGVRPREKRFRVDCPLKGRLAECWGASRAVPLVSRWKIDAENLHHFKSSVPAGETTALRPSVIAGHGDPPSRCVQLKSRSIYIFKRPGQLQLTELDMSTMSLRLAIGRGDTRMY